MTMSDHTPQDWNPRDPAVLADQLHAYDELRERCPVAYSDAMHWSLFCHADVVAVLDDPDTFINASLHRAIPNAMNGAEHTKYREILAPYFSASEMASIEPKCREIATNVMEAIKMPGTTDAVADIAEPIAFRTMCAFLGWPQTTWERVRNWSHGNQAATFHHDHEAARAIAVEYEAIVTEAIEDHRRQDIRDDVTGRLMMTEVNGHRWSNEDIIAVLRNWIAGHGTVAAAIGIVIAHLAENQNLQHRLREQPQLIPAAINEIPRMDGPLVANTRVTTREATINGRTIPAGERISLMWIAANRDPRAFNAPDEIHLDREQQANLLYGGGIHYCLGAPLAQLELRVTVETLLAHTAEISLASNETLERETFPGNGFVTLPVRIR
ncbi:cytochrome P450 [Sphaerospermopsis kisseleviana CS-549]|uniref:Cytochrome P450 like protein n=3 Tax=Sphaerospermopsis TaxID=752201 RepID=A0A479ZUY0_9CYAN|nr:MULTISPECIES: cytochrome P450 [Sphaerospermopsis]MBD2131094.1 cytochrome P450 [Sphaerospermopsis sp. FACHB-1094]MDB9441516.1 cytochrome P450 [Sphaerospermopsis kisseleviana CS-549]BAZ83712.1 cytochrome P450 like protein [Sphaerospermopsis kisseleviana NIES-73]GCL35058.1 cytochrome P450 like protein [Sphaerospermopsis reniformis]